MSDPIVATLVVSSMLVYFLLVGVTFAYVVGGQLPGIGYGHRRFGSLAAVVRVFGLTKVIAEDRRR